MRIAFVYDLVYPYSKGGVEKRIWDLAHLLTARGHEVEVLGTRCWEGSADRVVDGIRFRGIASQAKIHTSAGRRSISQGLKFAVAVGRALAGSRYDIVEVQGMTPLTCLSALGVCRLRKSTAVVTWYEVWRDYWNEYLGLLGYLGRFTEWLVAKISPFNTAVSRLAASRLEMLGGRNVALIPIGIDCEAVRLVGPAVERTDILYVGRLMSHKNIELLIDSVALLKARGVEPRTSIVGEGPHRDALVLRAREKGLEKVDFVGRVESDERILAMMKSALVFAFPSTREGFGLAPLEAAACGLPVVTIDHEHNAATELIDDGVTGLITAATASEFARALEVLLTDANLRIRMGRAATARAESFDWTQMAASTELFYHEGLTHQAPIAAPQRAGR